MIEISFVEQDGTTHNMIAEPGATVMEVARDHGVPGIDADCGGQCACATCHVYVAPDWIDRVGRATGDEADTLDFARNVRAESRLSCQIRLDERLDGLTIHLPANQR